VITALVPLPAGGGTHVPTKIVVHAMGEFIDSEPDDYTAWGWLRKIGLSAHAFVTPSGVIVRSRSDTQVGWHAKGHNMGSLGIEFLVPGLHTITTLLEAMKAPYLTEAAYKAGLEQCAEWLGHGITNIDRHSTLSPGRKSDPGDGFPWKGFLLDLGRKGG